MLEIKVENGRVRQRAEGDAQSLALDVLCAISALYNSMCDRDLPGALFRAIIVAGTEDDSPVWTDTRVPGGGHIDLAPGAGEVIKRVVERGQQHDGD